MRNNSKIHRFLIGTGWTLLAISLAAVVLHFSWNMTMPELFGTVKMSFKNAFGLVIFLATVAALVGQSLVRRPVHFFRHEGAKEKNA